MNGMYHGNFLNGLMHGDGHLWSADGLDLNGTWVAGKFTGGSSKKWETRQFGTSLGFSPTPSEVYVHIGGTVDNVCCGQGRREYPNGTVYEGEWSNGGADFIGEVRFANGDIFTGSCKDSDEYRNQNNFPGSQWSLCIVLGEGEMKYKESGAAVSCKWTWGTCEEWARPRVD
jgi:hypothetical protein